MLRNYSVASIGRNYLLATIWLLFLLNVFQPGICNRDCCEALNRNKLALVPQMK